MTGQPLVLFDERVRSFRLDVEVSTNPPSKELSMSAGFLQVAAHEGVACGRAPGQCYEKRNRVG